MQITLLAKPSSGHTAACNSSGWSSTRDSLGMSAHVGAMALPAAPKQSTFKAHVSQQLLPRYQGERVSIVGRMGLPAGISILQLCFLQR